MTRLAKALLITTGMATAYTGYTGAPLYCDRGDGLLFDQVTEPWVALDVSEFVGGRVQCGDEILVRFRDGRRSPNGGKTLRAQALDAGPLYPYVIADSGLPIVVDIPAHHAPFPGLSAPVTVINVTNVRRLIRERAGQ
jgi:hypothetical protein